MFLTTHSHFRVQYDLVFGTTSVFATQSLYKNQNYTCEWYHLLIK
jgi:hypothetical protein